MSVVVLACSLLVSGAVWGCAPSDSNPGGQPSASPAAAEVDEKGRLVDLFIKWAAAPGIDKLKYELPNVSLGARPALPESYSREHLGGFELFPKQVCPLIDGRCWKYEDGFELRFNVRVSGLDLPGGVVEFNRRGQIVRYEKGPRSEITRVLSATEARKLALAGCDREGLTVDRAAEPRFTSYMKGGVVLRNGMVETAPLGADSSGVLAWMFPVKGKLPEHCFVVECSVDAVTGATEVEWRCGGALKE
jgi:hypothetical protein